MFLNDHTVQALSHELCTHSDLHIDMETLSKSELVAMNRVLMWMFDWTESDEFVHKLFRELTG